MTVTLNGFPLVKATIQEPLLGVWFADVEVDTEEDITGVVTMVVEGITFSATVFRGGIESGRWIARIVGGASGLLTQVTAKSYEGVNVRAIVDDIMRESGEALDATDSVSADLIRGISRWQRTTSSAGAALRVLLESFDSSFRIQRDGTVFIGNQSFDSIDEEDVVLITTAPQLDVVEVAPLSPVVLPGVSFQSQNVSYVMTQVAPGGLRQEVWFA